jgi:hypothetical protein
VVAWWHMNEPRGRIVHELPLSGFSSEGRADLGIIFPDALILIELKSERDKLSLLEKQFGAMRARSHDFKCVLHERWFLPDGDVKDQTWINWAAKEHIWRFPEADQKWQFNRYGNGRQDRLPPNPYFLLSFLWADELRDAYSYAGVLGNGRASMPSMVADLGQKLTGRQINKVVCTALLRRKFAEADDPIEPSATEMNNAMPGVPG